uniref:Uncharacterized protein n=1 Tax=Aplanochytrium stocchinoi TaxID=215587 RepID=A0A6S8A789_9STRA|mmetsp:Transcript_92/g.139  ORF Transcript_92/g.139 Transcript_92/m.139 type:complete len:277 (-) Transcript_92:575-1405(-)|eukprot:CAMPEP_0204826650 /NCGR_PEP_ID=MMETSP1346-20131115/4285_1 /ASSEMBLY_ACC=CAM_ASM_000771 /TAXON_ID=215587 /ORGANISM="Aplanochytrium stocchinoi, Strain GSBS06" /LENGTH=276 /DNA_ID=CAMNT_0051954753 /DNA_START=44 /DNA_END=874 /DNA_ORIENTATION=+
MLPSRFIRASRLLKLRAAKATSSYSHVINNVRFCTTTTGDEDQKKLEEAKQAEAARLAKTQQRILLESERRRIREETIAYNKQVSALRKQYGEEHKVKEAERKKEVEEKMRLARLQKPRYPPHMLPLIEAYPDPTKEEYAEILKEFHEEKAKEREAVYERLAELKEKKLQYKSELVELIRKESADWFTADDIIGQTQLQAKVAERLELLYPLRTSFEPVLPSNPYKLEALFQDDLHSPITDKLEERSINEVYGYDIKESDAEKLADESNIEEVKEK